MILYHEVTAEALERTLADGLKAESRGEKGDDPDIIETDTYLDEHRPAPLSRQGISRSDSLYAFVGTENSLVDITNGATVALQDYPLQDSHLLRLSIGSDSCYVSDLDRYDAVRKAIANHETATLTELADEYWTHLVPLSDFAIGDIARPEVMVTHDIDPTDISVVS